MRIPARGSRIFAEWPLPTATSDVAPTELGVFRGRRSCKDFAPTGLVGECLVDQNAEATNKARKQKTNRGWTQIYADTETN